MVRHVSNVRSIEKRGECSTDEASVSGTMDANGLAASAIVAVDSEGTEFSAAPDAQGAFTLLVPEKSAYFLFVELNSTRIPIALRGVAAGFSTRLHIGSGAPSIDMGVLRLAKGSGQALTITDVDLRLKTPVSMAR